MLILNASILAQSSSSAKSMITSLSGEMMLIIFSMEVFPLALKDFRSIIALTMSVENLCTHMEDYLRFDIFFQPLPHSCQFLRHARRSIARVDNQNIQFQSYQSQLYAHY